MTNLIIKVISIDRDTLSKSSETKSSRNKFQVLFRFIISAA